MSEVSPKMANRNDCPLANSVDNQASMICTKLTKYDVHLQKHL